MASPRVLILRAPGVNCDEETAHAFQLAGATTESIHIQSLLENPAQADSFQVFCLPGGFSYGDDISAGRILGNQLRLLLADTLRKFREQDKLVLGICNGFQVLMKTGLLDVEDEQGPMATLAHNDCGRYEARWVSTAVDASRSVFLKGIDCAELPVAHAEGKFMVRDAETLQSLESAGRLALKYVNGSTETGSNVAYPANPNGADGNVAGICDSTGRVLGLMPHPERYVDITQHPQWTRQTNRPEPAGLKLFQNAVAYFG